MSEVNLNNIIAELIQEIEQELDETNVTGNIDGYQTPHAFSRKKDKERRKKNATQLGYSIVDNDVDNITEAITKITSSQFKKLQDAIRKVNPRIKISLNPSAPGGFEIQIPDDSKWELHTHKVQQLITKITGDHRNGRIFFEGKDFKRVKKDKYGNHLEPQFKKGDKVKYLGNKAVITRVNRESSGVYSYDVDYYKGNGRTKASNIFNKDGKTIQLESVNEASIFSKVFGKKDTSNSDRETFTATNKETGNVSTFKSKANRDAAVKAGTHTAPKKSGDGDDTKSAKPKEYKPIDWDRYTTGSYVPQKIKFDFDNGDLSPEDFLKVIEYSKGENDNFFNRKETKELERLTSRDYIETDRINNRWFLKDKAKETGETPEEVKARFEKLRDLLSTNNESVNEAKQKRPVNRWLELKNDDTMHPHKKMAMGLKELKYQLAETEKFFTWYNKIKTMNELDSTNYWKRTQNHIYKIKERLINIAKTIQEIEK